MFRGRVLDLCCGAGASALPAARAVAPGGAVDAVDLAAGLLRHGERAAADAGVRNVRFIEADATAWAPAGVDYDVVQCAFGVFMLPDMDADTARLVGLLRQGGRLAVASWAKGAIEVLGRPFYEALMVEKPEMASSPMLGSPITRIDDEGKFSGWLRGFGLGEVRVRRVPLEVPLNPELGWSLVTGSGFRAALSGLDDAAVERMRAAGVARAGRRRIDGRDGVDRHRNQALNRPGRPSLHVAAALWSRRIRL
ncbi:MAG: methyltransferase domain-containing protein [Pseudonocardiaceae bacterium]|nr:methyltransferase domain-containing protein [Pseudonocardiaceae bacterium]